MRRWMNTVALLTCTVVLLLPLAACAEREHREVKVRQEQRQSDPQEVPPGEMIVE